MGSNKGTIFMIAMCVIGVILLVALTAAVVTDDNKTTPATYVSASDGGNGLSLPTPADNSIVAVRTTSFTERFDDTGSCADADLTIFMPTVPGADLTNWYWVGDIPNIGHVATPNQGQTSILIKASDPEALSKPVEWKLAWNSDGNNHGGFLRKRGDPFALWTPVAPEGYVALGCVMTNSFDKPSGNIAESFRCVNKKYCREGKLEDNLYWCDAGSHARMDGSIWRIHSIDDRGTDAGTYWAQGSHGKPDVKVYCLESKYVVSI
ncbi:MAG: Vps62-related protein [Methanocella sp.]